MNRDSPNPTLTAKERAFMQRLLRFRKFYFAVTWVGITVACLLLLAYLFWFNNMNGTRFALVILILLQSWGNLRLYKAASIIHKINNKN